jgi:outer membrane protein assembly factor BamE (lipoprotein component of BamABCDE complex)
MNATMRYRPLLSLLLIPLLSAGCLFGGSSKVRREGNYVASETVNQIQPGKTSKAWVSAVIGVPSDRIRIDPEQEIWKYAYSETKDSSGYVFLIFSARDSKTTRGNVFVQFDGDVVSKTWRG